LHFFLNHIYGFRIVFSSFPCVWYLKVSLVAIAFLLSAVLVCPDHVLYFQGS